MWNDNASICPSIGRSTYSFSSSSSSSSSPSPALFLSRWRSALYPLCQPFNSSVPTLARADLLLDVLSNSSNHDIELLSLYLNEVDHTGHGNGPDSPQMAQAIVNVDNATEHLVQGREGGWEAGWLAER